jgi:hypothetical protein
MENKSVGDPELNRLYEDLLLFFSRPGEETTDKGQADPQMILTPVRGLSSLLANGH